MPTCAGTLRWPARRWKAPSLSLKPAETLCCHIQTLTDARLLVSDLGGSWESRIGAGRVTRVTDQLVIGNWQLRITSYQLPIFVPARSSLPPSAPAAAPRPLRPARL